MRRRPLASQGRDDAIRRVLIEGWGRMCCSALGVLRRKLVIIIGEGRVNAEVD